MTGASLESMLREFHSHFGVHDGWMPSAPTADLPAGLARSRWELLGEELGEYILARIDGDVVKIADAIADLIYVLAGDAVVRGLPLDKVLAEVHRSNMTKTNDPARPKLVKGPGLQPAGHRLRARCRVMTMAREGSAGLRLGGGLVVLAELDQFGPVGRWPGGQFGAGLAHPPSGEAFEQFRPVGPHQGGRFAQAEPPPRPEADRADLAPVGGTVCHRPQCGGCIDAFQRGVQRGLRVSCPAQLRVYIHLVYAVYIHLATPWETQ